MSTFGSPASAEHKVFARPLAVVPSDEERVTRDLVHGLARNYGAVVPRVITTLRSLRAGRASISTIGDLSKHLRLMADSILEILRKEGALGDELGEASKNLLWSDALRMEALHAFPVEYALAELPQVLSRIGSRLSEIQMDASHGEFVNTTRRLLQSQLEQSGVAKSSGRPHAAVAREKMLYKIEVRSKEVPCASALAYGYNTVVTLANTVLADARQGAESISAISDLNDKLLAMKGAVCISEMEGLIPGHGLDTSLKALQADALRMVGLRTAPVGEAWVALPDALGIVARGIARVARVEKQLSLVQRDHKQQGAGPTVAPAGRGAR